MNFSGINTTDYSAIINNAGSSSAALAISRAGSDKADDEETMNACKEFEEYMVEQVFKQAMSTIRQEEDSSGYAGFAYDMQAREYAKLVAEQGSFGLANQLYDSIKRNQGVTHIPTETEKDASQEADALTNGV